MPQESGLDSNSTHPRKRLGTSANLCRRRGVCQVDNRTRRSREPGSVQRSRTRQSFSLRLALPPRLGTLGIGPAALHGSVLWPFEIRFRAGQA